MKQGLFQQLEAEESLVVLSGYQASMYWYLIGIQAEAMGSIVLVRWQLLRVIQNEEFGTNHVYHIFRGLAALGSEKCRDEVLKRF